MPSARFLNQINEFREMKLKIYPPSFVTSLAASRAQFLVSFDQGAIVCLAPCIRSTDRRGIP